ncbi:MAG: hypothetical protein ACR2J6_05350 [Thermoleophilaceae bacterium]
MPELTPTELAQQPGPAALLQALRAGGEASPRELQLRTAKAPSTVSKWLSELRRTGLVDGPKPRPHLTAEGWVMADRRGGATAGGRRELDAAIARWPAEPQRAFLRMLVAAVAARWHLAGQRPQRHPGFVAAGPTGTGKTSMAQFVCEAFGLDAEAHVVYLGGRTAGEVLGRREHGEDGLTFEPSPMLSRPLVVFDEFDKAGRDQQRAALLCFQGDTRAVVEETPVQLRAVPMLACNTQQGLPIPPEYRRRSVVLDMGAIADLLGDLDLALYELAADGGPPRVELDALCPPAARLPTETHRRLRAVLRQALTEEGWTLCNVDAVELLALGYAAGAELDGVDLPALAIAAARDYLTCAETVGETRPGWRRGLASVGSSDDVAAMEAGQAERERVEVGRQQRGHAQAREALELVGARQELAEELRQARPDARSLLREHRPAGQGLRAQLEHLRERVLASRSEQRLDELRNPAGDLLTSVRELRGRDEQLRADAVAAGEQERRGRQLAVEREREAAAALRAQQAGQRRAAAATARQAKAQAVARRQAARDELTAVRAAAKPLEALWRRAGTGGERPLSVLPRTHVFGQPLLVFELSGQSSSNAGLGARLLDAVVSIAGEGTWRSPHDPAVAFHGSRTSCAELAGWGPATRSILAGPLRRLHVREDQLLPTSGLRPRKAHTHQTAAS